ncbi:MAG: glycosyltransferase family 4 protein, partial [Halobacteriota archaeon]
YAWFYRLMTPLSIRSSAQVIAVSAFTATELADRYRPARTKTTIVHSGATEPPTGSDPDCALSPEAFHLFVGARTPRKNFDGLLRGYGRYRSIADEPLDLAVVGPDRDIFGETPLLDTAGIRDLGYVSESTLGWLYRNAKSFLYPSLYEGFGFPILEAMSVGTPVVTSDRGATAEIADGAAVLVDPTDPSDIARGIRDAETTAADLAQRGRRRAAAFDWETTAAETLSVYREVLDA